MKCLLKQRFHDEKCNFIRLRYNAVIGTMVIFDVTFTHPTSQVEEKLRHILKDGKFSSGLAVGSEGFEIVEHQG